MPYPQKLSEPQILAEAARLIDDVGLEALSMRVLARRLGAHAPSLYRYFPDKDTLIRAVSTMFWDDLTQEVDRHKSLAGMARAYWDYGLRYPNRYAVIMSRVPEGEQPPTEEEFLAPAPPLELGTRLSPERALLARRVLWSYVHGAVSLRLHWRQGDLLDPEEAFVAGLEAFEAWLEAGAGEDSVDEGPSSRQ